MSPEIIAIVTVAIGLAGLILNGQRASQRAVAELRREVGALRERMAHLEGLLEGLREAIVGKAA